MRLARVRVDGGAPVLAAEHDVWPTRSGGGP
jgi:hypothetical protein